METKLENIISKREIEELKIQKKYTKKNIKRIIKGYPSQYIIGDINFYGYKIKVNKNVFIPRFETETLIYKTIKYIKKLNINNPKILDLCTGSGAISIVLKKELNAQVFASDISRKALKVAKENSKLNNVNINFIKSNLFKKINEEKFDVIISNPPYIPIKGEIQTNVKKEPKIALYSGKYGLCHINKILREYKKYTKNKFLIALEIYDNHPKLLEKYLKELKINYKFEKDLADKYRYLFIFSE